MIQVNDLRKSFGDEEILKGITATFEKGKTNMIIGASGSGKSVFLKNMLGLFVPDSGEIIYDGEPINEMQIERKSNLRKEMGMLFQHSALFDSLTVEENVMFPLRMFTKMRLKERQENANEILERVNLVGLNKKMPSEISGGQQKRVALARAVVNNPRFLFCDEPNSGLDPKTATVIDNLIQEITHERDITTVIISHDMNSVMEIGETIVFLKDGKLAWKGTNQEIFKTDNETVTDFVYSSNLFKKVRIAQNKGL
ncbi:phospholipid/cholesterol/gamma-HCH transport system ATP-binding protein [Nonlabens xylanidelens]|uniref:Phospholipid/cholesterol/gamma-HCH transport system ATP-binding protein n=1 Tax=Nonlabens xylanidelens TaxID=191564 RepID=A0A2S6IL93_9FLAO|nr:ATP-binding cassette domain-containing protein [Nonlabens xylanidelens]PPK94945.1 phospholipid/cholesterol/gamma-HCH transport system ATP-binding protein [Nonlabens xylanidelens]PQJ17491.1 ABC transporter ATP-binding protein [Nonlabens xylanidelens]